MEISEKIRIIKESYDTLRARKIIKTQEDFAQLLDVSAKSISAAKNGVPGYCTDSLVGKIMALMKEYDTSKYVDGYGEKKEAQPAAQEGYSVSSLGAINPVMKYVPTIPIHAYRAINFDVMEYFRSTRDKLQMAPIVMQFPGTDCYYFVNSEDMSPNLRTNDLLCLSRIPDDAKVTNGDLCIINTRYQGILERFVYDEGDHLLLKSTQPRWTDMRVPKDEIFSVFRILGGIRTNI